MHATTIGLDLAKSIFQVHGVDLHGKVMVIKRLRRDAVLGFFATLPPCVVGMEACATAHHWARQIAKFGHTVRLMPPQYVKPYVKRHKNDQADAEAMYQARGSSGVPLILDGQTVLGGVAIMPDGIDQYRRRLVAVCTDDGEAFFKRVGDPLPGLPRLRLFESVSGLGDSRVIRMEDVEDKDVAVPRFVGAREVIGVLYG